MIKNIPLTTLVHLDKAPSILTSLKLYIKTLYHEVEIAFKIGQKGKTPLKTKTFENENARL